MELRIIRVGSGLVDCLGGCLGCFGVFCLGCSFWKLAKKLLGDSTNANASQGDDSMTR